MKNFLIIDCTHCTSDYLHRVGIRTCSDYSPFGVELDGRTVSGGYRYGFQGMEGDSEVKDEGNSYDFGARILDPGIGKWFALDQKAGKYSMDSPYMTFGNNPIIIIPDKKLSWLENYFDSTFDNEGDSWDTDAALDRVGEPTEGTTPAQSPGWTEFKKGKTPKVLK